MRLLSYEREYEGACAQLQQQHNAALRGGLGAAGGAAGGGWEELQCELVMRPSFFERRQRSLGVSAAVIQAAWRGHRLRKQLARERSAGYQKMMAAAALKIQVRVCV